MERVHARPHQGQHARRRRPQDHGAEAVALHRSIGALRRVGESARGVGSVPQGAPARRTADGRAARWSVHGARPRRGGRTPGIRPLEYRAPGRLHGALPGLHQE